MGPDLSLLERWRAGDRTAGQELFKRYFPQLFRFFKNKVATHADDLTQQTFSEWLERIDSGDPDPVLEDPLTTSLVQLAAQDRAQSCGD